MADSWPYQEARKVLKLIQQKGKDVAVFECGFGPSGSPHIGTVAEMLRTKLIIDAFADITKDLTPPGGDPESYYQIDWILFADDLDALRKVPKNVQNSEELEKYLGVSVCDIPDPYGNHDSYAGHNIAELVNSLEFFGLTMNDYKLLRASQCYRPTNKQLPGLFNDAIMDFAERAHEIKDIATHDYKKERTSNYCPFLPIMKDGHTQIEVYDWSFQKLADGTSLTMVLYYRESPDGEMKAHQLINGKCKLQWKADWPLRWYVFDVDYEMHGKDLLGSAQVGDKIMRLMDRRPPLHMMYELFLDETGKKISKSDGTNDALHDWCHYTAPEVMMHFLSQNPRKARKLHFGLIPQMTDAYLKEQGPEASPISFSMLLNLVSITNTESKEVLWSFIQNYVSDATPQRYPFLNKLVGKAINYYEVIVLPTKKYRKPTEWEQTVLNDLKNEITQVRDDSNLEEVLTSVVYNVGKQHYGEEKDSLRNFFRMVYEVVMGQETGPRLPVFIMLYGMNNMIQLLEERMSE